MTEGDFSTGNNYFHEKFNYTKREIIIVFAVRIAYLEHGLRVRPVFKEDITMLHFDQYVTRYGEFGVQALIERLERYEGVRPGIVQTLEERWNALMATGNARASGPQLMAA